MTTQYQVDVAGSWCYFRIVNAINLPSQMRDADNDITLLLVLQNLRHLIGGFSTTHCKMQAYAQQAQDPGVKQFFQKSAQSAMECKQQLMQFLQ